MCVCFFVMCFFLNFRLVTYNSTNLQLFFLSSRWRSYAEKKMLGPRFCFVLFLFHSLSQRFRNHCLSPREALMLIYKISLCLFFFFGNRLGVSSIAFSFCFALLLGYVNSLGEGNNRKVEKWKRKLGWSERGHLRLWFVVLSLCFFFIFL